MYYLALNQQKAGPFTIDQIRDHLQDGTASRQTLFWQEGQADWQPLEHLPAAFDALPAAVPIAIDTTPTPAPVFTEAAAVPPPAEYHPATDLHAPAEISPAPVGNPGGYAPAPTGNYPGGYAPAPTGNYPGGYAPAPAGGNPAAGYPAAPGYGYPGAPGAFQPPIPTSGAAVGSLVCGILSLFGLFFPIFNLVLPLAAIICGHIGLSNIKRLTGRLGGRGAAISGLILGYLTMVIAVISTVVLIIAIVNVYQHPQGFQKITPTPSPTDGF